MKTTLLALGFTLALGSAGALAHDKHEHDHGDDAIGKPGVATATTRTLQIDMSDTMRFTPSSFDAKQGDTIRFVIKNSGSLKHEFILGTENELKAHYEQMKKNPEMEHSEPNMITLASGQTGEVVWQFTKAGKIDFACLQPGHYDAGMKGKVIVAKGKASQTDQPSSTPAATAKATAAGPVSNDNTVDGEVKKIDKSSGKITLKHGEIKNLEMPGMTMVFKAKNPAELDQLQVGDKVKFKAEKANGSIIASDIKVAQ